MYHGMYACKYLCISACLTVRAKNIFQTVCLLSTEVKLISVYVKEPLQETVLDDVWVGLQLQANNRLPAPPHLLSLFCGLYCCCCYQIALDASQASCFASAKFSGENLLLSLHLWLHHSDFESCRVAIFCSG